MSLRWIFMFMIGMLLVGCQSTQTSQKSEAFDYLALEPQIEERVDAPVEFEETTSLLTLSEEERTTRYQNLDEIVTWYNGNVDPKTYSQVQFIDSEKMYAESLRASYEAPIIIYLGFDDCPYCRAFLPKLNQLTRETDQPIYYYNVQERAEDATFDGIITKYGVETVPFAFVVSEGEPTVRINHHSSMQQIEAFVDYANQERP